MAAAFFMAAFAFRSKKGGLLAKTILAMYLTAFVVGGIYQALEAEKQELEGKILQTLDENKQELAAACTRLERFL